MFAVLKFERELKCRFMCRLLLRWVLSCHAHASLSAMLCFSVAPLRAAALVFVCHGPYPNPTPMRSHRAFFSQQRCCSITNLDEQPVGYPYVIERWNMHPCIVPFISQHLKTHPHPCFLPSYVLFPTPTPTSSGASVGRRSCTPSARRSCAPTSPCRRYAVHQFVSGLVSRQTKKKV